MLAQCYRNVRWMISVLMFVHNKLRSAVGLHCASVCSLSVTAGSALSNCQCVHCQLPQAALCPTVSVFTVSYSRHRSVQLWVCSLSVPIGRALSNCQCAYGQLQQAALCPTVGRIILLEKNCCATESLPDCPWAWND
jgi:hypothetical protein